MHDPGLRVGRIHPTGEAIRLLRADARHGEQASGLIEDDESVIKVENGWKHVKTPDQERRGSLENGKMSEGTDRLRLPSGS